MDEEEEFDRLEQLTRDLLKVPKGEVTAKLEKPPPPANSNYPTSSAQQSTGDRTWAHPPRGSHQAH